MDNEEMKIVIIIFLVVILVAVGIFGPIAYYDIKRGNKEKAEDTQCKNSMLELEKFYKKDSNDIHKKRKLTIDYLSTCRKVIR